MNSLLFKRQCSSCIDHIGVISANRHVILAANDVFLGMLGRSQKELESGELTWERITRARSCPFECFIENGKFESVEAPLFEEEFLCKDGSGIKLRIKSWPLTSRKSEWLCVIQDTNMDGHHICAKESTNLWDVRFLAKVSHELRTPLSSILIITQAMAAGVYGSIPERQQRLVASIEDCCRYLLRVVNDFLDLNTIQAGAMKYVPNWVDLSGLIGSCLLLVKGVAQEKELKIIVDNRVGNIRIFSDELKLKQILINLIGNAIKFTPKYGVLGLIVEKESLSDWIKFIVWDNGIGIASEHLDVVFEPFVQIDSELSRSEKGTGLGLTLAKGLARLLGGEIAVESTLQAGSRFTLRIPCAADLTRQPPLPEGTMPLTQQPPAESRWVRVKG